MPVVDPDVALAVDHGGGAAHPHRALAVAGGRRHLEGLLGAAALGDGDDPAVVVAAVAVVAAEAGHHVAVVERQPGPLELGQLVRARQHDRLVQQHRAGVEVEADQVVLGAGPRRLVGDGEHLAPGRVDDGCAGDADGGRDVAAREVPRRHGRADVRRPQHRAGVGGQLVDGVVLGGDDDATRPARGARRRSRRRGRPTSTPAWLG